MSAQLRAVGEMSRRGRKIGLRNFFFRYKFAISVFEKEETLPGRPFGKTIGIIFQIIPVFLVEDI